MVDTPTHGRVVVTGHLGYIGSVLTPMLEARGHEVFGIDSGLFQRATFGPEPDPVPGIELDIRSVEPSHLEGAAAVIHLAGLSNDPLGDIDASVTDAINNHGAVRVAKAAKTAGVERFIFSSSCSTYGAGTDDLLDESAPLNPVTPYGRSKVDAEVGIHALADANFSPTSLRNATAFGASPRIRFDLVVNNLVAWAYTTGAVRLKSTGTAWRPLAHIADISAAMIAVLEGDRAAIHDEIFNVSHPTENYRVVDIARIVEKVVPGAKLETAENAITDTRNYRVDSGRISRALPSFQPEWTAERGAIEVLEQCRRNGLTVEEFEGTRYNRLPHLLDRVRSGTLTPEFRSTPTASVQ